MQYILTTKSTNPVLCCPLCGRFEDKEAYECEKDNSMHFECVCGCEYSIRKAEENADAPLDFWDNKCPACKGENLEFYREEESTLICKCLDCDKEIHIKEYIHKIL